MTEEQKLILSIIFFIVSAIALIIVLIYTKKVVKGEKEKVDSFEKETLNYYQNLKLLDNKFFPYFNTHASGVRRSRKYIGDKDNITGIEVGKYNRFYFDRILYIINGKLKYPFSLEKVEEKEYIIINDKIETIELLVSFEKPSHFLIKYKVNNIEKDKYEIELIGVDNNDGREDK